MSKGSTRTLCIPETSFGITLFALEIIPCVLTLPISYFGFRESAKLNSRILKIVYRIASCSLLIGAVSFPVNHMFDFEFAGECDNFTRIAFTTNIGTGSYMFSLVCICCLYSIRMSLSFKNSKYASSKWFDLFSLFGILIQCILLVLTIYLNYTTWNALKTAATNMLDIAYLLFWTFTIFGVVNIMYNLLLLTLFSRKIYQISKSMIEREKEYAIEKGVIYTLCLSISLVSTVFTFFIGWSRGNLLVDSNEMYMIHLTVFSWDIFLNSLSINLQFDAAKNKFNILCKCCKNYLMKRILNVNDLNQTEQEKQHDNDNTENVANDTMFSTMKSTNGTTHDILEMTKTIKPNVEMTGSTLAVSYIGEHV